MVSVTGTSMGFNQ